MTPSIVINGHPYRGELEGPAIFQQVCASFKQDATPEVCTDRYKQEELLGSIDDFVTTPNYTHHFLFMVIFAVVLLNIAAIFYCTKRRKREEKKIRNEV